jgi:hypothetical protein
VLYDINGTSLLLRRLWCASRDGNDAPSLAKATNRATASAAAVIAGHYTPYHGDYDPQS